MRGGPAADARQAVHPVRRDGRSGRVSDRVADRLAVIRRLAAHRRSDRRRAGRTAHHDDTEAADDEHGGLAQRAADHASSGRNTASDDDLALTGRRWGRPAAQATHRVEET